MRLLLNSCISCVSPIIMWMQKIFIGNGRLIFVVPTQPALIDNLLLVPMETGISGSFIHVNLYESYTAFCSIYGGLKLAVVLTPKVTILSGASRDLSPSTYAACVFHRIYSSPVCPSHVVMVPRSFYIIIKIAFAPTSRNSTGEFAAGKVNIYIIRES